MSERARRAMALLAEASAGQRRRRLVAALTQATISLSKDRPDERDLELARRAVRVALGLARVDE